MLAILAAVAFLLAVIFRVGDVDAGDWDAVTMIALGLLLLALDRVFPIVVWRRGPVHDHRRGRYYGEEVP